MRSSLESKSQFLKGSSSLKPKEKRGRGQNSTEITLAQTSSETALVSLCQLKKKNNSLESRISNSSYAQKPTLGAVWILSFGGIEIYLIN
jgi:hypothetical protein